MSILQFMEMSVIECILCSMIAFLFCLLYSGIGSIFLPKKGVMLQSIIGMTFTSAFIVLCAEFCAAATKYVIAVSVVISFIITILKVRKKEIELRREIKSIVPIFILFFIIFAQLMRFVVPEDGIFHFNCHQTYFSGPPIELLHADYFSRLRIMDVYPIEWSKYHFFNGSFISIPLICFLKKNYISYLLSKMIVICFYAGAFIDIAREKYNYKRALLTIITGIGAFFLCACNGIIWSIGTNNFSCIFMMLLTWLMFEEKNYPAAMLFSISFAITKSGSIVSGTLFLLYSLYKLIKTDKAKFIKNQYKELLYCLAVGLAILSVVFVGSNPSGEQGFMILGHPYAVIMNMLSDGGWNCLMPLGGAITRSPAYLLHFEFLFLAVIAFLLAKYREKSVDVIVQHKKMFITFGAIYLISMLLGVSILAYLNKLKHLGLLGKMMLISLLHYAIPLFTLFVVCKNKAVFITWIVSLCVNFALFNAGITLPNYAITAFILLMIFSREFVKKLYGYSNIAYKAIACVFICFGIVYFSLCNYQNIFFLNPADHYHEVLKLQEVKYSNAPFEYHTSDDANLAKLNGIKGNRTHWNVAPDLSDIVINHVSMAMRFVPESYQNE